MINRTTLENDASTGSTVVTVFPQKIFFTGVSTHWGCPPGEPNHLKISLKLQTAQSSSRGHREYVWRCTSSSFGQLQGVLQDMVTTHRPLSKGSCNGIGDAWVPSGECHELKRLIAIFSQRKLGEHKSYKGASCLLLTHLWLPSLYCSAKLNQTLPVWSNSTETLL